MSQLGLPRHVRRCMFEYAPVRDNSAPRNHWHDRVGLPRRCTAAAVLGGCYCARHDVLPRLVRQFVPRETRPLWQRALENFRG